MDVSLEEVFGKNQGVQIPVRERCFVIGRGGDCNLQVPSRWVSRRHCELKLSDGRVILQDMGSLNGTFVNGQLISDTYVLNNGDCISLGPRVFEIQITEPAQPVRPVPEPSSGFASAVVA